jgi:hypothetical protein
MTKAFLLGLVATILATSLPAQARPSVITDDDYGLTWSIAACGDGTGKSWPAREGGTTCVAADRDGCQFGITTDGYCRWPPTEEDGQ